MTELVTFAKKGAVGVITVDNPASERAQPRRARGHRGLRWRAANSGIRSITAMVLIGAGRGFIAGADIKRLGKPRSEKAMRLRDVLEGSAKPIVAAIHGHALGGGLETAMLCNYRIAVDSARVGLPEVLIGILPGAGGTQRLPRLTGAAAALEMIVTGRHVPAPEAGRLGILDEVVPDDGLESAAIAFAEKVADRLPPPVVRDRRGKLDEGHERGLFDAMRKKIARKARNQRAPYACIEAVEAAVSLTFDEGLAKERALFEELVNADEAKALRYAFFSEREARKVPGVARGTPGRAIARIGIVGAGTMGGGIAMACANAGLPVRILERDRDAMERGLARVRANYETSVKRGSMSGGGNGGKPSGASSPSRTTTRFADVDFVVEAVFEDMDGEERGVHQSGFACSARARCWRATPRR